MRILILIGLFSCTSVLAQQALVVPAQHSGTDAPSMLWVAGFSDDLRQQTLIDTSHLSALVGRSITAMSLRRNARDEAFNGGQANLVVNMSVSSRGPLSASPRFAENPGRQVVTVFSGVVQVPPSPPVLGSSVSWDAQNSVRITFAVPFPYSGGNLCIDIVGTPDPGQTVWWWPADAAWDPTEGTATNVGSGCGIYTDANGNWAFVTRRQLVPGGVPVFDAWGTPGGAALFFLSARAQANAVPLSHLGAPPNCFSHLAMNEMIGGLSTQFGVPIHPGLTYRGGPAWLMLRIPNEPWVMGATLASQWMDVQQGLSTSNAISWTVASSAPTLGMSLIEGGPQDTMGEVHANLAHVVRFEYQ